MIKMMVNAIEVAEMGGWLHVNFAPRLQELYREIEGLEMSVKRRVVELDEMAGASSA